MLRWKSGRLPVALGLNLALWALSGMLACSSSGGGSGATVATGGGSAGQSNPAGASSSGGAGATAGAAAGGAAAGGAAASAGAGAGAATGAATGGSGGSSSNAQGGSSAGGSALGGVGGGVSSGTGGSGAGAGGTGASGAAGAAGGSGGGGGSCAGRAVSLSANGTGSDSDAAHARVVIDLMSDLPIGNSNRTIEFWAFIKTTDWVGEKNEIFEYGGTTSTTSSFGLDFGTNPVTGMATNHATLNPFTNGGFNDDSTDYLGITSSMNQWVHIALTWNGTAIQTYVNGTLRITSPGVGGASTLSTTQTAFTLGCNDKFNCFNGYFDELRIWNIARGASDIQANYNKGLHGNESGLVGYWKFDDAAGSTTAVDSVTTAGHSAHAGTLMAVMTSQLPTFVTPATPAPVACP